jgi:G6PDH family F420-dependent oxidoreductase
MPINQGITLSSEEHGPGRLVEIGQLAEDAGFDFLSISDHYHPWVEAQGHSPFVWSVLGALSQVTSEIEVAVGVTCPTMRIHPAILAQAVATTAVLLPGRFVWGVGSGENLNEHVVADGWPPADIRLDRLAEAVEIIRQLWTVESLTYRGEHFWVEDARIMDKPNPLPPIVVSAFGEQAAVVAAQSGDGLWTSGVSDVIDTFKHHGGQGPIYSQVTVCWADETEVAAETAHRLWPNTTLPGQLAQDLRTIEHFEQATRDVTPEMISRHVLCGPEPDPILARVSELADAGVDHVYFHQIGDDQEGFVSFWQDELREAVQALAP